MIRFLKTWWQRAEDRLQLELWRHELADAERALREAREAIHELPGRISALQMQIALAQRQARPRRRQRHRGAKT